MSLKSEGLEPSWPARLRLELRGDASRTVLARAEHEGPLCVQRGFYPEPDGVCHVYVLHPPGGVVGGDVLELDLVVGESARAVVTTPAATKFYRSPGRSGRQEQRLRVRAGGALEWLPQESILFDGAHAKLATRVELDRGAEFLGWEITCLGRTSAGERFTHGSLDQRFEIWREGVPLRNERLSLEEASALRNAPWGLGGRPVTACFVCVTERAELVREVRDAVETDRGELFSVTAPSGALVCRYLGAHAERARACFARVWEVLRPAVLGRPAVAPRIWAT